MIFKPIIGLEIHIELKTKSKMFCSCPNEPDKEHPNLNICPICLGLPGVLPVINKEAVKKAIKTAIALNCQIPEYSRFERKNYFYPDLPKGYQISQYEMPLVSNGLLKFKIQNSKFKIVRIRRIHLEEDTGKLIHEKDYSLVDFNRAGIPLMELVTEPDLNSAKEARKFAEELQLILRYLKVSNADMEKGQMRIEANVSLAQNLKAQSPKLGTKVEIKNLNSFRALEEAIDYEIKRQKKLLKSGKKIVQETRGWDDAKGKTFSQREKEEAYDYRYFPEPDLPILALFKMKEEVSRFIPELPEEKRERFFKEYHLSQKEIDLLVKEKEFGDYFEKVSAELGVWMKDEGIPEDQKMAILKIASNYLISDLKGLLEKKKISFKEMKISPENFAELIILLWKGKVSSKIAKILLEKMIETGADPSQIIEKEKIELLKEKEEIEKIAMEIIKENKNAVLDYRKGKIKALHFLMGQAMKKSKGKAHPKILKEALIGLLSKK